MKNLQVLKKRMFTFASILFAKMSHVVFFPHDIHWVTLDTHWISWGKHYCFIKSSMFTPCVSPSATGHYQIRPTSAPPCIGPSSNNAHGISLCPTHKNQGIVDVPKMQCQTWLWPHPRSLVWGTPWKVFVTHGFSVHFWCFSSENCCCWTWGFWTVACNVAPLFLPLCASLFSITDSEILVVVRRSSGSVIVKDEANKSSAKFAEVGNASSSTSAFETYLQAPSKVCRRSISTHRRISGLVSCSDDSMLFCLCRRSGVQGPGKKKVRMLMSKRTSASLYFHVKFACKISYF
jgi:hypothetical protein